MSNLYLWMPLKRQVLYRKERKITKQFVNFCLALTYIIWSNTTFVGHKLSNVIANYILMMARLLKITTNQSRYALFFNLSFCIKENKGIAHNQLFLVVVIYVVCKEALKNHSLPYPDWVQLRYAGRISVTFRWEMNYFQLQEWT